MEMNKFRLIAGSGLLAAVLVAGCKSQPAPTPAQNTNSAAPGGAAPVAQNGVLQSDGTYAPANGAAPTQPASSTSGQPAPTQQAAAPIVQAPPPVTAPSGTRVVVRTTGSLSASHNDVGDAFSGLLGEPLIYHGQTLFARGTHVSGTVIAAKKRGRFKGAGDLGIEINSIGGVHVRTSEYEKEASGKGKRTGGLIGGGAGLGAIIGGLAGGGKGAVIGGLAGAGAGTAGAAYTGNKDVVIPAESVITFRLTAPLTVSR